MKRARIAAVAALLLLPGLAAGCGRGAPDAAVPEGEGRMDGLTSDQIEQQAEPMSPERAEELGIVDTTIHVEQLTSPGDSAIMRDSRVPRDTTS